MGYMHNGAVICTRHTAWLAGVDAANKQMRADGRATWSADDADLAAGTQARLMRAGGLLDEQDRPTPLYLETQAFDRQHAWSQIA